jgi:hypothetical protein
MILRFWLTFALRGFVVDVDAQVVAIRDLKHDPCFGYRSTGLSSLIRKPEEERETAVKRKQRTPTPWLASLWGYPDPSRTPPTPAKPIQSIKNVARRSTPRPSFSDGGNATKSLTDFVLSSKC